MTTPSLATGSHEGASLRGGPGKHDLVIRGGTLVTINGTESADVAIDGEHVSGIGGSPSGLREIDARGCLVFPGGIDMHVHLTPLHTEAGAPQRPDDFDSGSRAAAAGGITTFGNMSHQLPGETLLPVLNRDRAVAEQFSVVDFVLHPVLNDPNPAALAEILDLPTLGHPSLKLFMVFEQFEEQAQRYLEAMANAARSGTLVLIHCEDHSIISTVQRQLLADGKGSAAYYPASRPVASEVAAVQRGIAFAEVTGATVQIVHLSSSAALQICVEARKRGVRIQVETRPLYLHLADHVFEASDAARFVGNPPPRSRDDRNGLWEGLASGDIDTLASDHAPWTIEQKLDPRLDITSLLPGVADLETMLPMLFSEGVVEGRLTPERFAAVTSTNAARIFGLYPLKGAIRVGSHADLVVWDPLQRWVVDGSSFESKAGYSPYDGWKVVGAVRFTISRGDVVRDPDGVVGRPGRGLMAPRGPISWRRASKTGEEDLGPPATPSQGA